MFAFMALSGCAGPRTGPFDVPAATSGADGGERGFAYQADDVRRAAAEIGVARIYFAFNKAELTSEAKATLSRIAEILRRYPSIRIRIGGYCDARGSAEYNYALGARRARAAYAFLTANGAAPGQLDMVTFGKTSPAVRGATEAAMAQNRRDEFIVLTTCY